MHSRASRGVLLSFALMAGASSLRSSPSQAFCGFYVSGSSEQLFNNATRVALMRSGSRTVLTMSNDYQGPAQDFAMVVPVPVVLQAANVKVLPHDVFSRIEVLTAPRLVEYWEQDPCQPQYPSYDASFGIDVPFADASGPRVDAGTPPPVRVEAQFAVGEYEVVILSATESTALETWLRTNGYNIPQGSAAALDPYVREQSKFFVAKVNLAMVMPQGDGHVRLSPLRFHYDSQDFRLPVRLGLLNAPEKQDLIVYLLGDTRYEVANYPNVTIPTNLDVYPATKTSFGSFYAGLFDKTLAGEGGRAIVTEYAWGSSSCDPCPGPTLTAQDLASLGADVAYPTGSSQTSLMLTRLHTRYDRATLTEDLVFREASPIVGGRELFSSGQLEQGATQSWFNNFQARYAIRYPWTGRITCTSPVRGRWGGPPVGTASSVTPALDLANTPRNGVDPQTFVVPGQPGTVHNEIDAGTTTNPMTTTPKPAGCACSTPAQTQHSTPWTSAAIALSVLGVCARRKRRSQCE